MAEQGQVTAPFRDKGHNEKGLPNRYQAGRREGMGFVSPDRLRRRWPDGVTHLSAAGLTPGATIPGLDARRAGPIVQQATAETAETRDAGP